MSNFEDPPPETGPGGFEPELYEQFVRLFALNHRRLFGYILAFVHDRNDAEEVFQETSLILWKEFAKFRPEAPFMPWAGGIAFNQIRKFRRRKKSDRLTFSDALLADLAKDAGAIAEELDERQRALAGCIEKLNERQRGLLESFYGGKLSAGDVAQKWGRSVHTVYKSLKLVRRALFDCINNRLNPL